MSGNNQGWTLVSIVGLLAWLCVSSAGAQPDCNLNGVPDGVDIANGTSADCNYNGIPDECDLLPTLQFDQGNVPLVNSLWFVTATALGAGGEDADLDADGDGDVDLVSFDFFDNSFTVILNDGGGDFPFMATFVTGPGPTSGTVADLDGDGDQDVAALMLDGSVWIHLNNGNGIFSSPADYGGSGLAENAWIMTGADYDGDGDIDLAVANIIQNNITILFNDGLAGFPASAEYAPTAGVGYSVVSGDVDGDGDVDMAATSDDDSLVVLLNSGAGDFPFTASFPVDAGPMGLARGDVDGDGNLDFVTTNEQADTLTVLLGSGSGTFAPANYAAGPDPFGVDIADLDGDGTLDLAVANWDFGAQEINVLRGIGGGAFIEPVPFSIGMATARTVSSADFDGNGSQDLAIGTEGGIMLPVLINISVPFSSDCNGNGVPDECDSSPVLELEDAQNQVAGFVQEGLEVGDLDGDGYPDLVTASHGDDRVAVNLNQGDGTYAPAQTYFTGMSSGPWDVALLDVDGDDDLDVVTANIVSTYCSVLLNDGTGVFGSPSTIEIDAAQEAVISVDIDADGDDDFVVTTQDHTAVVFSNDGGGDFSPMTLPTGMLPSGLTAADLDDDGNLDLAVTNRDDNTVSILLADGAGGFELPMTYVVGDIPRDITAADFDLDGSVDLVVANSAYFGGNPSLSVLTNDGFGNFAVSTVESGDTPYAIASGDIDGNGTPDLAVANREAGGISVLLNLEGNLTLPIPFPTDDSVAGIIVSDLDGDSLLDIASSNFDTVSVLLNASQPAPIGDCNGNGVPDDCDIAAGTSPDGNGNGIPDECEGLPDSQFVRGDSNADANLDLSDPVQILGALFIGGIQLGCVDAADANDDGTVSLPDPVALLNALFAGGAMPTDPFPSCGEDPTDDALDCEMYDACP